MKPQPTPPEERLLDDLVSTPEREDFFASVEQDLVSRMEREGGSAPAPRRNGWIAGSAIVIGAALSLAAWFLLQPDAPVIVDTAPYSLTVEAIPPEAAVSATPGAAEPSAQHTADAASPRPSETTSRTADPSSADPSQIGATARSSSPMAQRALREVDSLRTALAAEPEIARQLSLRYDIGVRLRIAGNHADAQRQLESLATDAHAVNADVLSARSLQQAAMAARDRGQLDRARTLLTSAIDRLPAGQDKLRSRWEKELAAW